MLFDQVGPDENLKDVALKLLQNAVTVIPVMHSTSLDGSYPQLLHLASLSDILKCNERALFCFCDFNVLSFC